MKMTLKTPKFFVRFERESASHTHFAHALRAPLASVRQLLANFCKPGAVPVIPSFTATLHKARQLGFCLL